MSFLGDMMIVKVSNGTTMTMHKQDNDYSDVQSIVDNMMGHHSGQTEKHALACAQVVCDVVETPKNIDADFDVLQKQNVPGTHTIIPPEGVAVEDIGGATLVVCYLT